ncbi:hypothetical protein [Mangrovimonas spongiae]|uniref:Tetratricopeptide repeat protein n=1 Tax=Mangrovimonas spongiae TaxID=2494697 RepID=A0A3R9UTT2_9FLAO|nr:hypothetical protein [Mangrovimonas spongiae]RSK39950.1 hypothetical protein EJA19_08695 [Mangrovimonas spongiae]
MDNFDFKHILQNPKHMLPAYTEDLQSIIDTYPYFQSPKAILLKALKNKGSFKYNKALKTTAAYTTDRSILFDFITSEDFLQNEISESIKQNSSSLKAINVTAEDISVNKHVTIDDNLKQQIQETSSVLDPELFTPKESSKQELESSQEATVNKDDDNREKDSVLKSNDDTSDNILKIGEPFEFTQNEKHSFNEWLKLTRFSPIEREQTQPETPVSERDKKFKLIDKFISKNPKLKPEKTASKNKNLAEQQMIQPDTLMTETLARIYVEQKNYKKAIQSYKILSLKYPEKSGFFADQIKAIQKLQEQNK